MKTKMGKSEKALAAEGQKIRLAAEKASRAAYADAAVVARTCVGGGASEPEVTVATEIAKAIEQRANIVWGV
jgi:hypothetical protein